MTITLTPEELLREIDQGIADSESGQVLVFDDPAVERIKLKGRTLLRRSVRDRPIMVNIDSIGFRFQWQRPLPSQEAATRSIACGDMLEAKTYFAMRRGAPNGNGVQRPLKPSCRVSEVQRWD